MSPATLTPRPEAGPRPEPGLSPERRQFLNHMQRWGSDGYPVQKIGRGWQWIEAFGVKGAPTVYKRKRDAVEAVERFLDILIEQACDDAWALAEWEVRAGLRPRYTLGERRR